MTPLPESPFDTAFLSDVFRVTEWFLEFNSPFTMMLVALIAVGLLMGTIIGLFFKGREQEEDEDED